MFFTEVKTCFRHRLTECLKKQYRYLPHGHICAACSKKPSRIVPSISLKVFTLGCQVVLSKVFSLSSFDWGREIVMVLVLMTIPSCSFVQEQTALLNLFMLRGDLLNNSVGKASGRKSDSGLAAMTVEI